MAHESSKQICVDGRTVALSRVVAKRSVGVKHVFDLEVKGVHNYFAGGINVHNCDYHKMLDIYGNKTGEELYKLKDTFVHYKHRRLSVYPAGPDKRILRGRCLTGGTLVNTNRGFYHFSELVQTKGQVPVSALTVDSPYGQRRVSHTYKDRDHVYKVVTKNGFSLSGTAEHPLLVLRPDLSQEWIRLDELKEGDWIVSRTKANAPLFGDTLVNKDVATLAGFHLANGHRTRISSNDPEVVRRLKRSFKRLTGRKPTPVYTFRADDYYLSLGRRGRKGDFNDLYFKPLGYAPTSSKDKEIPLGIRTASKEILHEFLESYFQCDCGVNGGGSSRSSAPSEVEVGSASRKLAEQLHTILFHAYGILGRLQKQVRFDGLDRATGEFNGRRTFWLITITGADAYRFIKTFKRAKVQKYAHRFKDLPSGYGSDRRNVPYVRSYIKSIYEEARLDDGSGKVLRSLSCENGEIVSKRYPRPSFTVSSRGREIVEKPLPEFLVYSDDVTNCLGLFSRLNCKKCEVLEDFLEQEAHYEQVISVKRSKKTRTIYDVTVPKGHAFTANCLVSHNTRYMACLDGKTLVSTAKGLVPIKNDLIGSFTHVGDKKFGISNWACTGVKQVFKVKLENGLYIKLTANHELKTDKGWVRADNLNKGDLVKVSLGGEFPKELALNYTGSYEPLYAGIYRQIEKLGRFEIPDLQQFGRSVTPITSSLRRNGFITRHYYKGRTGADGRPRCYFEVTDKFDAERMLSESAAAQSYTRRTCVFPNKMTPELASLLGYYVADGSYSKSAVEFYFASSVPERLKHFKACFKSVFGVNPNVTQYETDEGTIMTRYAVGQKVMKDFLRYVGLKPATSRKKEIPWSILQAPKECAAAFIAALYDCDGGASKTYIWYLTKSFKLGSQLQILLQRFGILSDYKAEPELKSVKIRERIYQEAFLEGVGFSTRHITLPEKADYAVRYAHRGIVHIPVKSIRSAGKHKVYDVTVDDSDHGFTANGIVAHNSIDELGWFPNDAEAANNIKMNAGEVYTALENSLATVAQAANLRLAEGFYDVPPSYFMNISSPSSVRDKIMELVRMSKHSSHILGIHKPTWQMNPTLPRDCPFIEKKYHADPIAAERDFGANPPRTNNGFITNEDHVSQCLTGKKNPIVLRYKTTKPKAKGGSPEMYAVIDSLPESGERSVLALDGGYSNNSFAFAIGHLREDLIPVISVVGEIIPMPGIPINYSKAYTELLVPLIAQRNVIISTADRWNSLKILSDLEAQFDLSKKQHSLKYEEMLLFKSYLADGQIILPKPSMTIEQILAHNPADYPHCFKNKSAEHLVLQALTVQDTGVSVIKGDNLTDDILRASMLCFTILMDEFYRDDLLAPPKQVASAVDITKMAAARSYSGGAGSGSSMGVASSIGVLVQRR